MSESFLIKVPYEGYSRGYLVITVEAESLEEALENAINGYDDYLEPIRDDTSKRWDEAEEY